MKKKRSVRLKLGLTQLDTATLLGMDRSVYALYEAGNRSLSMDAIVKLSQWEKELSEITEGEIYDQPAYLAHQATAKNELETSLALSTHKKRKLEEKIAALKETEKQHWVKVLLFSRRMEKLDPSDTKQANEKRWLEILLHKSEASLPKAHTIPLLEAQYKALKAEISELNVQLGR